MKIKVALFLKALTILLVFIPSISHAANSDYKIVEGSDDFDVYKDVFLSVAKKLIESGKCSEADFIEMGGWVKSVNHKSRAIYFTYCGGFHVSNKIYMNAETGKILRN